MTSSASPPEVAEGERAAQVAIAVFAKAPVAGSVKTRLVAMLGAEGAARLHERLVERALATAFEARLGPVALWCAPDTSHPFFAQCAARFGVELRRQEGADLGERMHRAFEVALERHPALLLVGSDCPTLEPRDLAAAARALDTHDAVLIPAEDGGYVLVGLTRPHASLFEGVAWGTAAVMEATRARLAAAGLRWAALPALWDVDRVEDYARLRRTLPDLALEPAR
jgi:hypothetical protein